MLLALHLGHQLSFAVPSGGLAVWAQWNIPVSLWKLAKDCRTKDLFIPKNILYQNKNLIAMRIGFGHLTTDEMQRSLEIMSGCLVQ